MKKTPLLSILVFFLTVLITAENVHASVETVVYTRENTQRYGFIGINDGAKDSRWRNLSADGEYLDEYPWLGFGHGNRCHQIFYIDFSDLSNQLGDKEYFLVSDVSFSSNEVDQRHYLGSAEICPIMVDWVSGQVNATWNNIEGSSSGILGHGPAVQTGGRINSTTYAYPITGEETNPLFKKMIEDWLNGDVENYGFLVRQTADTTSSVDYHNQWNLSITYEIIPEPTTLSLLALGGLLLRKRKNNFKFGGKKDEK